MMTSELANLRITSMIRREIMTVSDHLRGPGANAPNELNRTEDGAHSVYAFEMGLNEDDNLRATSVCCAIPTTPTQ